MMVAHVVLPMPGESADQISGAAERLRRAAACRAHLRRCDLRIRRGRGRVVVTLRLGDDFTPAACALRACVIVNELTRAVDDTWTDLSLKVLQTADS